MPTTVLFTYLSDQPGSPEGHQALAALMHVRQLRDRAGIELRPRPAETLAETSAVLEDDDSDIAVVMVSWREPVDAVAALLRKAKNDRPDRKLVYLDYYAPTASPNWAVLPLVDVFAKRQLLRDLALYQTAFQGGTIFTDFLARHQGYDLNGWSFGTVPPADQMDKVVSAWNLGVTPRYRLLLALSRFNPIPWALRPVDINARISLPQGDHRREWYEVYRLKSLELIRRLGEKYRLTSIQRASHLRYLSELALSKITFSPFGWGEVCFRDYEAVCCGSLLLKPSMDHLRTSPDIYEAGVTYVAVAWDHSDLLEKVEYYLAHPREAQTIVREAQRRLRAYYRNGFVPDFLRTIGEESRLAD